MGLSRNARAPESVGRAALEMRVETQRAERPDEIACIGYGIRDTEYAKGREAAEAAVKVVAPVIRSAAGAKTFAGVAGRCSTDQC